MLVEGTVTLVDESGNEILGRRINEYRRTIAQNTNPQDFEARWIGGQNLRNVVVIS